jgi:hypothetical protein
LGKRKKFARLLHVSGPTEIFAHTLMFLTTAVIGTYFRLVYVVQMRGTFQFWRGNCETMERVTVGGIDLRGKHGAHFEKIKKDLKRAALVFFIPTLLHVSIIHGYTIFEAIETKARLWEQKVELYAGGTLFVILAFLHFGHCLWMIFFIKLYTASFRIISSNLTELSSFGRDGLQVPPEIYYAEIFSRKVWPEQKQGKTSAAEHLFDSKVRNCIQLFQTVEKQVKAFNHFFATKLIFEILNCIVNILATTFFACLWISRGLLIYLIPLVVPLFVYNAALYHLGTESWLLTKSAIEIARKFQDLPLQSLASETQVKVSVITLIFSFSRHIEQESGCTNSYVHATNLSINILY